MIVIPSLELLGGNVVRLVGNRPEDAEVLADDPIRAARELQEEGAVFFQLVDLDAVLDRGDNLGVLESFVKGDIPCQVRGGTREIADVERLLELGADRVVASALLLEQPEASRELVERFGRRILGAVDADGGHVRVWGAKTPQTVTDAAATLRDAVGVQHLIYTPVDRQSGVDSDELRALLAATTDMEVFAGVHVHERDELEALRELKDTGLAGVVLRSAVATAAVL